MKLGRVVIVSGGNFQFDGTIDEGSVAFSGGGGLSLLQYGAIIGGASVAVSGTVAVSGSYSDSFEQSNPGSLFLGISDNRDPLSATDASGDAVAGSGATALR